MTQITIKVKYPITNNVYSITHNEVFNTLFDVHKNDKLIGTISYTEIVDYIEKRNKEV